MKRATMGRRQRQDLAEWRRDPQAARDETDCGIRRDTLRED